jgi:hypothetical protein
VIRPPGRCDAGEVFCFRAKIERPVTERRDAIVRVARSERIHKASQLARLVVLQKKLPAAGVGERGQLRPSVAAGDAVAVGVLDVGKIVRAVELPHGAVRLDQSKRLVRHDQLAGVGAGGRIGAVVKATEESVGASRSTNHHSLKVGQRLNFDFPVVAPAASERSEPVSGLNRLAIDSPERERESGGRQGGVGRCGQGTDRVQDTGCLENLEIEEGGWVVGGLADLGEVIHIVAEHQHVVRPKGPGIVGEITPNGVPSVWIESLRTG